MALRLNPVLEIGELMNLKPRSTHGLIKLIDEEVPCMIDLAGDFCKDLQGKRIQFSPNPKYITAEDKASTLTSKHIHPHQVGTTGTMTAARWAKVPTVSANEAAEREGRGEAVPFEWKRMLYMEWFCQNGRVVIELIDPIMEIYVSGSHDDEVWEPFEWPDTKPDDPMAMEEFDTAETARQAVPFGQHYKRPKMDGMFSLPSFQDDTDDELDGETGESFNPANEFDLHEEPSDLDSYLAEIRQATEEAAGLSQAEPPEESVDDVIAEMEYMDEILEGKHDSDPPVVSILGDFSTSRMTDGEAEIKLKEVLAQLALYGIGVSICEHFSAKDTLRIIRDDWGLESKVHPGLIGSGWVRGFMTCESCPKCEAEFEADYEKNKDHYEQLAKECSEERWNLKHGDLPFEADGDVPF